MNRRKFLLGVFRGALAAAAAPLIAFLPGVRGTGARVITHEIQSDRARDITFAKILRAKRILDEQNVRAPRYVMLARHQVKQLFGETGQTHIQGFEILYSELNEDPGVIAAWGGGVNVFVAPETVELDVWAEGDHAELKTGKWIGGRHA